MEHLRNATSVIYQPKLQGHVCGVTPESGGM